MLSMLGLPGKLIYKLLFLFPLPFQCKYLCEWGGGAYNPYLDFKLSTGTKNWPMSIGAKCQGMKLDRSDSRRAACANQTTEVNDSGEFTDTASVRLRTFTQPRTVSVLHIGPARSEKDTLTNPRLSWNSCPHFGPAFFFKNLNFLEPLYPFMPWVCGNILHRNNNDWPFGVSYPCCCQCELSLPTSNWFLPLIASIPADMDGKRRAKGFACFAKMAGELVERIDSRIG